MHFTAFEYLVSVFIQSLACFCLLKNWNISVESANELFYMEKLFLAASFCNPLAFSEGAKSLKFRLCVESPTFCFIMDINGQNGRISESLLRLNWTVFFSQTQSVIFLSWARVHAPCCLWKGYHQRFIPLTPLKLSLNQTLLHTLLSRTVISHGNRKQRKRETEGGRQRDREKRKIPI